MRFTLLLGTLVLMLGIAAQVCSCEKLALSGPKKYKSDIASTLADIRGDIQADGKVAESTISKLDKHLAAWEADMSGKESYHRLVEMRDLMDEAKLAENPFNLNREIQGLTDRVTIALDAEVRD